MKHLYTVFFMLILFSQPLFGQSDSIYKPGWNPAGVLSLNISQVAFDNWSLGGENSFALVSINDFRLAYKNSPVLWKNHLKVTAGQSKTGDNEIQTTDNELFFESIVSYDVGWQVAPYAAATFSTVIFNGYNYDTTPRLQTSAFVDPAYVTESFGFTYNKNKFVTTRLGLAFRETVASRFTQYTDDPDTPGEVETFKFETGIESVTGLNWNLLENITYSSSLSLFSAFETLDIWDVTWDNTMTGKINDYVNASLSFKLVYDKDQSARTQLKEAIQIGITYALIK